MFQVLELCNFFRDAEFGKLHNYLVSNFIIKFFYESIPQNRPGLKLKKFVSNRFLF